MNARVRTKVGHTPLTAAVSSGSVAVVHHLLSRPGIDVNATSKVWRVCERPLLMLVPLTCGCGWVVAAERQDSPHGGCRSPRPSCAHRPHQRRPHNRHRGRGQGMGCVRTQCDITCRRLTFLRAATAERALCVGFCGSR